VKSNFPQVRDIGVYLDWKTTGLLPASSVKAMQDLLLKGMGSMHKSGNKLDMESQDIYYEAIENIASFIHVDYERIVPISGRESALNFLAEALSEQEIELWTMDDNAVHAPFISRLGKRAKLVDTFEGGLTVASTVSSLTGARSGVEMLDSIRVIDVSFETAIFDLGKINTTNAVVIAEGSTGLLGPIGSGYMMIGKGVEEYLSKYAIGTLGVSSVKPSEVSKVRGTDRFVIDPVNLVALHGLAKSMEFVSQLSSESLSMQRRVSKLRTMLKNFPEIRDISVEKSEHVTFYVEGWNAQELAILLNEDSKIQVRGGQLCSHLAIDKIGVPDAIRVSMHCITKDDDLLELRNALEQMLS